MRPDRTFRSRVDGWLAALVGGAAAAPLVAAVWLVSRGEWHGVWLLSGWGAVMMLTVGALSFPLRYTFWTDRLHIQSGWLHWDVPYSAVRSAAFSSNPLSAPAWSLKRVKLELTNGSFILVSPDDRNSFIEEMAARCPHLTPTPHGLEVASPPL